MSVALYVLIGGLVGFVLSMLYSLTLDRGVFRRDASLQTSFNIGYIFMILLLPFTNLMTWHPMYPEVWFMNWVIVAGIGMLIGYIVYAAATYL
jgi:hypothetical protein